MQRFMASSNKSPSIFLYLLRLSFITTSPLLSLHLRWDALFFFLE
jgi:hypothetical protein